MYTTPGGCDEEILLYSLDLEMDPVKIAEM
jgi:hypothetical protein